MQIHNIAKEHKMLLAFVFLVFMLIMAPSIIPGLFVKDGFAWTTINTQNYMAPDFYYYVSGIREIINGNILIKTPDNLLSCESARIIPYWFSAIPYFFFGFNISIPLSIFLCIISTFLIMYFIYRNLELDIYSSLIYSFVAIYFVQVWSHVPFVPFVPFGNSSGVFQGIFSFFQAAYYELRSLIFMNDYEISMNFRYINSCASNVFLFLNMFLSFKTLKNASLLNVVLCHISALFMLFSYPTHTVISMIFMLSCFLYSYLEKDFKKTYIFLSIGLSLIAFVFIFDYIGFLRSTYYQSHILKNSWDEFNAGVTLKDFSLRLFLENMLNKYSIAYLIFVYCFRDKIYGKLLLLFYFGLFVVVSVVSLIDGSLFMTRFTANGVDAPWFFGLVYALGIMIQKIGSYAPSERLRVNTYIILSSIFIALPAIGSINFTYENLNNNSRFYPTKQAEIINWVSVNLCKSDVVAALDFTDAHFLTYTGKYINFISYVDVQKITIEESLLRYIAVAKLCNMSRSEFNHLLKNSIRSMVNYNLRLSPPFIKDRQEFHDRQFAHMLIYWPCIKKVWGMDVSTILYHNELNEYDNQFTMSQEFEEKLMDIFDDLDVKSYFSKNPVDYVLLSREYYGQLAQRLKLVYPIVFVNNHGLVFKINKD